MPRAARAVAREQVAAKIGDGLRGGEAEDGEDVGFRDRFAAKGDELVEHRFGIAQPAFSSLCDGARGGRFQGNLLFPGDVLEVLGDQFRRDAPQIEALAAGKDGGEDFLDVGGGEDEFDVFGRLF